MKKSRTRAAHEQIEGSFGSVRVEYRDVLLSFYDFPAEHWPHLRTTNPLESAFATVRLRQRGTKGNGTRQACLTWSSSSCNPPRNAGDS